MKEINPNAATKSEMTPAQADAFFESYDRRTHLYGRIMMACGIVLMLAFPFVMSLWLHELPDMDAFWKGLVQVGAIYIPSCIAEFLIYTPMLGAGGSYLAFITGNLINLKIPCAVNARDIVGVQAGSRENEIVSTLAIAASAATTIAVVAVGTALLTPLSPVLSNPVLAPAFNMVVPSLFGALAYKYFKGNMKIAAAPLLCMCALFIFVPSLIENVGFMIVPSGALAIGIAWLFWKRSASSSQEEEVPQNSKQHDFLADSPMSQRAGEQA